MNCRAPKHNSDPRHTLVNPCNHLGLFIRRPSNHKHYNILWALLVSLRNTPIPRINKWMSLFPQTSLGQTRQCLLQEGRVLGVDILNTLETFEARAGAGE